MGARNEFGSTVSLTNLLTVSQLGCEQKKLLGFGGLCRAPLTSNFSRAVWVTPPVRVYGSHSNFGPCGCLRCRVSRPVFRSNVAPVGSVHVGEACSVLPRSLLMPGCEPREGSGWRVQQSVRARAGPCLLRVVRATIRLQRSVRPPWSVPVGEARVYVRV